MDIFKNPKDIILINPIFDKIKLLNTPIFDNIKNSNNIPLNPIFDKIKLHEPHYRFKYFEK